MPVPLPPRNRPLCWLASTALLGVLACARAAHPPPTAAEFVPPAKNVLDAHLRFLSDDTLEGRGIGTRGGRTAAAYIEAVFRQAGLQPAFPEGFRQPVAMTAFASDPKAAILFGEASLAPGVDFVGIDYALPGEAFQGEPLFVGYGIVAPEEGWDDYKGVDVRGRLLVAFTNEPGRQDPARFRGKELTVHGRWRTKFEVAARAGAAGMLLIHTDADAGYTWDVVRNSWSKDSFRLAAGAAALPFEGWVTETRGRELARAAGADLDALRRLAETRDFTPRPLPTSVAIRASRSARPVEGTNIVGVRRGAGEGVVYLTAHYDHLGIGHEESGDSIYNGAVDNGSALALLLGLAQTYGRMRPEARPTLVFAAVDAEEEGLLGSEFLARNPAVPHARALAAINFEMSNVWGRTRDVVALGADRSELKVLLEKVLGRRGLRLSPDPAPEQGFLYRSDQYSFARVGVPALWIDGGTDYVGREQDWGGEVRARYRASDYHHPSDEVRGDWDLDGLVQLADLTDALIAEIARAGDVRWLPTSEFQRSTAH